TLPTRRSSDLFFPINLFTEEMVLAGLVIACLFAGSPTFLSPFPLSKNATIEGVVLLPSLFCITTGSLPSITATQEFVVPKSIPIIFPISFIFYSMICFQFLFLPHDVINTCAKQIGTRNYVRLSVETSQYLERFVTVRDF